MSDQNRAKRMRSSTNLRKQRRIALTRRIPTPNGGGDCPTQRGRQQTKWLTDCNPAANHERYRGSVGEPPDEVVTKLWQ